MARYVGSRIVAMFITLFLIISLSFILIRLMPQNIFDDPELPPYVAEMLEKRLHLDKPMHMQYYYFVKGIVVDGDWGTSIKIRTNLPVFEVIKERIPVTMFLNVMSLFISLPLGIIGGTVAALGKNRIPDYIISFFVVLFISIPSFVFASMMQYVFTYAIPIFPTLYNPNAQNFRELLMSTALPIVALALGPIGTVTRYLRGELIETMSSEFLLLARTKGLSSAQATIRHAFRNSLVPLVNIIVPMFTGILGGSLVIESIYSIPGMGGMLMRSINAGDHPLTIALLIFYSIISLTSILVIDMAYGIVDPRIRMGGGK